jgi:hypothetical protein
VKRLQLLRRRRRRRRSKFNLSPLPSCHLRHWIGNGAEYALDELQRLKLLLEGVPQRLQVLKLPLESAWKNRCEWSSNVLERPRSDSHLGKGVECAVAKGSWIDTWDLWREQQITSSHEHGEQKRDALSWKMPRAGEIAWFQETSWKHASPMLRAWHWLQQDWQQTDATLILRTDFFWGGGFLDGAAVRPLEKSAAMGGG